MPRVTRQMSRVCLGKCYFTNEHLLPFWKIVFAQTRPAVEYIYKVPYTYAK